jgi:hypothetical protein
MLPIDQCMSFFLSRVQGAPYTCEANSLAKQISFWWLEARGLLPFGLLPFGLLPVACCLLPVACCLLPFGLLPVACCLWPAA